MVIGREKEQQQLMSLLSGEESQFCVVYGRRRVGKTYLIRETFSSWMTFQHTGLSNAPKKEQLREFRNSMIAAGADSHRIPSTWYEAFGMLQQFLECRPKGKKVVFLDEMSWMDTPKSGFISALEHFWNSWASARKDIVLIVCGSATSWLINKVVKNYGGLHNRLTMKLYLQPFTLKECREYTHYRRLEMSDRDILETYMIMGGIPYYWSFLQKGLSLSQNIDRIFFAFDAPLSDEYNSLYNSLFRNAAPHLKVIAALSKRKTGLYRGEILKYSGLDDNAIFSRTVEELEQCNFIRCYQAFGKKKRDVLYQLMDNFTLFYFRFMAENKGHDERYWSNIYATPRYTVWAGLAFERACLWHIKQIRHALGIEGVVTNVCSWNTAANEDHDGAQIDLLLDRNDNIINLCEIKYGENEYVITKEEDKKLCNRKMVFKTVSKTRKALHLTMITPYGVRHNANWNNVQSEVTMADLFG